jgi:hypothetical protein
MTPSRLLDGRVPTDQEMARCCLAGLWLLHNFLDESHHISQEIHSQSGSYWHAILHRREPDFSNSKYWFQQVGDHPIYPELQVAAEEALDDFASDPAASKLRGRSTWDAFGFVDLCEAAMHGRSTSGNLCRRIAAAEWRLLFDYCYRHAAASK